MALAKHQEEIIERRGRNGARIVYEYQYPHGNADDTRSANPFGYTPEKMAELRAFVRKVTQECEERLSKEMTLVYKLNDERTCAFPLGYMTKGEAAGKAPVVLGGELLDLDNMYGGLLVRHGYIFVSDAKLEHGLRRYPRESLLSGLIDEKLAAVAYGEPRPASQRSIRVA